MPTPLPTYRLPAQAAIERLGLERWRGLLHVRDVAYHDTPLHRVCRFGHRLQVARLLLQHAPRYR